MYSITVLTSFAIEKSLEFAWGAELFGSSGAAGIFLSCRESLYYGIFCYDKGVHYGFHKREGES